MAQGSRARADISVRIRPAEFRDRPFLLALAPRVVAFGTPSWRNRGDLEDEERRAIAAALDDLPADAALLVADGGYRLLGFIYLVTRVDDLTGQSHGHVYELAVTPEAEGRGVGRALMAAGEHWARGRGLPFMTLHVLPGNERGRGFYARLGYNEDMIKLHKPL